MDTFDKEKLKNILLLAKGSRGVNQFAMQSNISRSYISELLNLKRNTPPSMNVLTKIASVSQNNITLKDLMVAAGYVDIHLYTNNSSYSLCNKACDNKGIYEASPQYQIYEDINIPDNISIFPFLNNINTSERAIFNKSNITKYGYENKSNVMYGTYFYCLAPDNSMINSKINKDDVLTVRYQDRVENNKVFLMLLHKKLTLRRVYIKDSSIILVPDNNKYEPITFNIDSLNKDCIEVVGKIVYVKFKL